MYGASFPRFRTGNTAGSKKMAQRIVFGTDAYSQAKGIPAASSRFLPSVVSSALLTGEHLCGLAHHKSKDCLDAEVW
jgi:hypothetical protein